jgi:hypothetical protein
MQEMQRTGDSSQRGAGGKASGGQRMRMLYDSVLDTCPGWEGRSDDSRLSLLRISRLPELPSRRLSVDFSRGASSDQSLSEESSNELQVKTLSARNNDFKGLT